MDKGYRKILMDYLKEVDLEINDKRPTWQETFIEVAKVIARRSKDTHTKVGAVLVKDNCICATGYNGEPRNCTYNVDWDDSEKYDWCIHAELNCIANACYNGVSVKDCDIYLTLSPCHECIKILIQHGIKNVYYLDEYKDFELTKKIAEHCNINLIKI